MTFITNFTITTFKSEEQKMRQTELLNRLKKNEKKRATLVKQQQLGAYRLYDRDIPAFPYIIDRYMSENGKQDIFVIYERGRSDVDEKLQQENQIIIREVLATLFAVADHNLVFKTREIKSGAKQYQKLYSGYKPDPLRLVVREGEAKFYIHPRAYLDTGLFLDHRPLRFKIKKIAGGKRFLNLFCYTSSVSVQAALGGADTVSVDKSKRYIAWSKENFTLNDLSAKKHQFVVADSFTYLREAIANDETLFDIIFIDPPTFSNEKKKELVFEVEKDHQGLIRLAMQLLTSQGILFFSTNKRKFNLSTDLLSEFNVKDISIKTIPFDFDDKKIHYCFQFQHKELT